MTNKYRIFDKQKKVYCEEPDYRWLLSRKGELYNSECDEWFTVGERYVVEFSTNIFDVNNIEIFEGDTCEVEEYYPFGSDYIEKGFIGVVEFDDGQFAITNDIHYQELDGCAVKNRNIKIKHENNKC